MYATVLRVTLAAVLFLFVGHSPQAGELQPGDEGYKHTEKQHAAYQEYFSRIQENAFENLKRAADKMQPGDQGYMEGEQDLNEEYKKVFDSGKCSCSTGECRPTEFRPVASTADNPKGVEVKVNRVWCKPSVDTVFLELNDIPDALKKDAAHVCAYGTVNPVTKCPHLECIRVNNSY